MNRTELVRAAKERLNGNKLTQDEVAAVLSAVLDSIGDALRKGDKVQLTKTRRKAPAFRHGDISRNTVGHTGIYAPGDCVRPQICGSSH